MMSSNVSPLEPMDSNSFLVVRLILIVVDESSIIYHLFEIDLPENSLIFRHDYFSSELVCFTEVKEISEFPDAENSIVKVVDCNYN